LPINGEKVECVLVRKLPDMEWDVELDTSLNVLMRETLDDGSLTLREKQQDDVFGAASNSLTKVGSDSGPAADMKKYQKLLAKEQPEESESSGEEQPGDDDDKREPSDSAQESSEDDDDNVVGSSLLAD
jgi:hypothetical protein